MTPNRENIRKWVEALRSGEYQQGTGYLQRDGQFCCLGVACELAGESKVQRLEAGTVDKVIYYGESGGEVSARLLPPATRLWLGLTDRDVRLSNNPGAATLNDSGHTFAEIADAIEKEYLS